MEMTVREYLDEIGPNQKAAVYFSSYYRALLGWEGIVINHNLDCELHFADKTRKSCRLPKDCESYDIDADATKIAAYVCESLTH
jgi:hypothetical protein